jgi:hypothetical protein
MESSLFLKATVLKSDVSEKHFSNFRVEQQTNQETRKNQAAIELAWLIRQP